MAQVGMMGTMTVPADLRPAVAEMMAAHWRAPGFTVPHADVYPWQWLWDSCFHALIWAELGDADRAVQELATALAAQDGDGFVPHMTYHGDPDAHAPFWGRSGTSSITQPPMHGHAVAELVRRGIEVPADLVERSARGLRFLLEQRGRTPGGLVMAVHPWETGCDDSPRWDGWCPGGFDPARWREAKGDLLATVDRSAAGAPLANPAFAVGPAGFNALIAFNARELAGVTGDDGLRRRAVEVAEALAGQWDAERRTWVDDGPHSSGRVRTADALLPALVAPRSEAFAALADPEGLGGRFGPAGVDRREPAYDGRSYWRGSVWPQVGYLLWRAAAAEEGAGPLADGLLRGAATSGLAEYWDPDDGAAGGAVPQSWTGLVLLLRPGA
jgi:hypothetical protein